MKNGVPKNDKKRRKQLTEEIAKLEADLNEKHEEEIRQLKSTSDTKVISCVQVNKRVQCSAFILKKYFLLLPLQHFRHLTDTFLKVSKIVTL